MSIGEDVGKLEPLYFAGGNGNNTYTWNSSLAASHKSDQSSQMT